MTRMEDLKINPKFRDLIPKLSDDEFAQLEKNILEDGEIREAIIAWDGVIIDGHNRYKIWMAHKSLELSYKIEDWHFENEYQAMSWACNNQLGRRNLTDAQRTYLLGKRYENEKMAHGASDGFRGNKNKVVSAQNEHLETSGTKSGKGRTAEMLAKEYGIGRETVKRAEKFSKGIDIIEKQEPELKDAILSGAKKISKSAIRNLSEVAEPEEQKAAIDALVKSKEPPKTEKSEDKPHKFTNKEIIGNLYGDKEKVSYSADNALEELRAILRNARASTKNHLSMHNSLLESQKSRNMIVAILADHVEEINKIKEDYQG